MRELSCWLDEYSSSHQNPINQKIHKVTVPGIFVCIVGLIWSIPPVQLLGVTLNWVWVFNILVLVFYFRLSLSVFILMLGFTLASTAFIWSLSILIFPIFHLSLSFLSFFWLAQFVGYKVEGHIPSLSTRSLFLLIGPIWVFNKN
ncbi:DUF962 domain-containing protein [Vibrio sp. S4M6]|uniref:Mpo1 family 2-hydroxy fatty acid dioxygenase n=1 Tax=Vibrio sinus TaxID=2946865 RepID=UPI00202A264E|nr:Mpo1-like protein [Vibrio sinus]MCL9780103.1 DUF962 domain-containing protein [Vibrio sinus]